MGSKFVILVVILLIVFLNISGYALVSPRGSEEKLDIATWNIREFPWQGQGTVDTLAILIRDLQLDIIAAQEITDTVAFANLLSQLPGWDGFYAPSYSGTPMKEAFLYRTDQITAISWEALFWGYTYEFPRPPLRATFEANLPSGRYDFYAINLHLKAGSEPTDFNRRLAAMLRLKNYLDATVPSLPDHDWLILGDFNDEVNDPQTANIFWHFLQDSTHYRILTLPLAGNPYWASYPSYNSLIDHLMITTDMLEEYGDQGQTITLRLGDEYPNYSYRISDHRPVMSSFSQPETKVFDESTKTVSTKIGVYPNPFNSTAIVYFALENQSAVSLDLFDCLGRQVKTLYSGNLDHGHYRISINGNELAAGIYLLKLTTDSRSSVTRITLIK